MPTNSVVTLPHRNTRREQQLQCRLRLYRVLGLENIAVALEGEKERCETLSLY